MKTTPKHGACDGLLLLLLCCLNGCSSQPPARLLVLSSLPATTLPAMSLPAMAPVTTAVRQATIRVEEVALPEYLDSYALLTRVGSHEVSAVPDYKWAEKLSTALTRLLRQRAAALGYQNVDSGEQADLHVLVDIEHFEPQTTAPAEVLLAARWRLQHLDQPEQSGQTLLHQAVAGNTATQQVAAMEQAAGRLATLLLPAAGAAVADQEPPSGRSVGMNSLVK